jgi:ankyrin repeat protein
MAAWKGYISVVKELIEERNAEINARTNNGRTALELANEYDKTDIAAYLISRGGIV